jgi:hypothetical protein
MSLTPGGVHEALDCAGWLEAAHGPGVYALRADVPDSAEAAHRRWRSAFDAVPGAGVLTEIATAERVAYAGASRDVYGRLMDHANGTARQAAFLSVFPPREIVTAEPREHPFEAETRVARGLREDGWTVWADGEVV